MLAAMGLLDVVGTTASGWLTDRFNPRLLLFIYYGLRGLSLLALPHAFAAQHLSLGVFVGVLRARLDRHRAADRRPRDPDVRRGVRARSSTAGSSRRTRSARPSSAVFAGAIRDHLDTYDPAFYISGLLCVIASLGRLRRARTHRRGAARAAARQPEPHARA